VLAAIDWRDDASFPARVTSWQRWIVAMSVLVVLFASLVFAATQLVNQATADACLAQQARDNGL